MHISQDVIRYVGPMAVGFIIVAAYRIGRKVVTDKVALALLLMGGITTYLIREPWIYPLVLILGGAVRVINVQRKSNIWNRCKNKSSLGILGLPLESLH